MIRGAGIDPFVVTVQARGGEDPRFPGRMLGESRWLCRVCDRWHTPLACQCSIADAFDGMARLRGRIAELERIAAMVPELQAEIMVLRAVHQ